VVSGGYIDNCSSGNLQFHLLKRIFYKNENKIPNYFKNIYYSFIRILSMNNFRHTMELSSLNLKNNCSFLLIKKNQKIKKK